MQVAFKKNARKHTFLQHGFTLLELVVVICLISILGIIALNSMWAWRIEAERAMIDSVTGNIRSALGMRTAELALQNQLNLLPRLSGSNPMILLAQPPSDYIGIQSDASAKTQTPGIWYFNPIQKALVYTVRYTDGFKTNLKGQPRIRFRIKLIFSDTNNNKRFDPGTDAIAGLNLLPMDTYEWFNPD